jgi:dihydrofolate reductase
MCDCSCTIDFPGQHEVGEDYVVYGGRDICQQCLELCREWRPWGGERVLTEMEKSIATVFGPLITQQLEATSTFRKWMGRESNPS